MGVLLGRVNSAWLSFSSDPEYGSWQKPSNQASPPLVDQKLGDLGFGEPIPPVGLGITVIPARSRNSNGWQSSWAKVDTPPPAKKSC